MKKKVLSLLLALSLCLTLLPTAVLADEMQEATIEQAETVPAEQEETPAPRDTDAPEAPDEEDPSEDAEEPSEEPSEEPQQPAGEPDAEPAEEPAEELTEEVPAEQPSAQPAVLAAADGIAVQATHSHPICGASCTDKSHIAETWVGASSLSNSMGAAKYYLSGNITLKETWHPADGTVLCLSGHTITTNGNFNAIEVDAGKTFTLTDCGTTGKVTHGSGTYGRGVKVLGTFHLYGGSITGNQTSGNYSDGGTSSGAGVYVASGSAFLMYGGSITGNTTVSAGAVGGGVYVDGGSFTMSGGSITGNKAGYSGAGGGVYLGADSTFTVSGTVDITGNETDSAASNVYLPKGRTITIDGTLDAASKIGISTPGEASADIATGAADVAESIFSSDVTGENKNYTFTKEGGTLHFNGHDHVWKFNKKSDTSNTINAKCATPGCPVTTNDGDGNNGGFVWLKVQDTEYGSNSKNAWVDPSQQTTWRGPAVETIKISYQNKETGENLGTTAPTLPGSYTASITVEDVTVTCAFTISKATPTINWNRYPYSTGFTGTFTGKAIADPTGVTVLVNGSSSADLLAQTTFTWYKATVNGSSYSKASDTPLPKGEPIDAGDYLMEAFIPGTGTTNEVTYTKGVTIQKAHDLGGSDVVVPVALKMYPSAEAKTYPVELLEVLKDYRHGGSLALNSTGIISYDTDLFDKDATVLEDDTIKIAMKPTADVAANRTVRVSVYLTSRNYETIPVIITLTQQAKPTTYDFDVTMDGWTYGNPPKSPQYEAADGVTYRITYTNTKDGTTSSERPTDAGDYTVTVSYETATEIHSSKAVPFTIAKRTLAGASIRLEYDNLYYTGAPVEPSVTEVAFFQEAALTEGRDYDVSYQDNTNAGTATVTVTGKGNYKDTVSREFRILQIDDPKFSYPQTYFNAVYGQKLEDIVLPEHWSWDNPSRSVGEPTGNLTRDFAATYTPADAVNYKTVKANLSVHVAKSAAPTLSDPAARSQRFNDTAVHTISVLRTNELPAGENFSYEASLPSDVPGNAKATLQKVDNNGTWSYQITGGSVNDIIIIEVKVSSPHYETATYRIQIRLTDRDAQTVTFDGNLKTKAVTFGDAPFTVTATAQTAIEYTSSAPEVAEVNETTGEVTIKGAGTATITATAAQTGEFASASASYTLTVNEKSIALPVVADKTYTYDGTAQTYAITADTAYVKLTDVTHTDAGTYTVTASLTDTANTKWADGTTDAKTYTFPITPATVTVTVLGQSAYVGDAAPDLSAPELGKHYTVSGLLGEDVLGGTLTLTYEPAPDMTQVGETAIKASGLTSSANYTIVYEDGTLTIAARSSSSGGSGSAAYPVSVPGTSNGSVSVTPKNASRGDTVTVTVKPESGYEIDSVTVKDNKGNALKLTDKGNGVYTFTMPAGKVEISAAFTALNANGSFRDVSDNAYYADAVKWAVENGITEGTSETTFSPNAACTRAQIVTFLWRAAGSPAPKSTKSFADVTVGSYYANAVAWAVENGITEGTSDAAFSPNAACTRAQIVTFLFRSAVANGMDAVTLQDLLSAYADADSVPGYAVPAMNWALYAGILQGDGTNLMPNAACTRAQIVTFLFRANGGK